MNYDNIGEQGDASRALLDLGFGGVAIELEAQEDLPENLIAVFHVPTLPPVRVSSACMVSAAPQGSSCGCAFIS